MASVAENLQTARENYAQQLADLSNPDARKVTYSIGGRSVSWTEYQRFLLEMIRDIDGQVASSDPVDVITAVE